MKILLSSRRGAYYGQPSKACQGHQTAARHVSAAGRARRTFHCCAVILQRADIRRFAREKLAVHVWFDSMRRGLKRISVSRSIPFRRFALARAILPNDSATPSRACPKCGCTVERDRPRHRQRGAGTPAAAYCFLSQTAVSGFRIDDGLVAAVVWTGTGT